LLRCNKVDFARMERKTLCDVTERYSDPGGAAEMPNKSVGDFLREKREKPKNEVSKRYTA